VVVVVGAVALIICAVVIAAVPVARGVAIAVIKALAVALAAFAAQKKFQECRCWTLSLTMSFTCR
jgi:hypothetical protein